MRETKRVGERYESVAVRACMRKVSMARSSAKAMSIVSRIPERADERGTESGIGSTATTGSCRQTIESQSRVEARASTGGHGRALSDSDSDAVTNTDYYIIVKSMQANEAGLPG